MMPNGILNNILVIFTKLPPSGPPKVGFQQNTCVLNQKIMKLGAATFFPYQPPLKIYEKLSWGALVRILNVDPEIFAFNPPFLAI